MAKIGGLIFDLLSMMVRVRARSDGLAMEKSAGLEPGCLLDDERQRVGVVQER